MALGGLVLGSLILYLKGMRTIMFQLSGYCSGGCSVGKERKALALSEVPLSRIFTSSRRHTKFKVDRSREWLEA